MSDKKIEGVPEGWEIVRITDEPKAGEYALDRANSPLKVTDPKAWELAVIVRMTRETPQGYRLVASHESVLSTDLYWSVGMREWILIGDHRIKYPTIDRSSWPNIIRLEVTE